MKPNYAEYIQDVVITLHMNLKELQERKNLAESQELDHIEAKLLAYHEVLAILRSSADELGIPRGEIGLL